MVNLQTKKIVRYGPIVGGNILVFMVLFFLIEVSYRLYRDGIPQAFTNIAQLFSSGVPYSNLGTGNWVVYDDELGYRLNTNRDGVNSLSVRGAEPVIPKPKDTFRLMFTGDSVPWDNPGYVSIIEEELNGREGVEVINAAVPGYTTYQELIFLKTRLLKIEPDATILTFVLNDNHKILHRFDEQARMLITDEARNSLRVNNAFDEVVSRSYVLTRAKARLFRVKQGGSDGYPWENASDFNTAWKDDSWGPVENYLVQMNELLTKQGSKFAIVIMPIKLQLNESYLNADYEYVVKPQRKLMELCDKHNILCFDLFPEFRAYNNQGIKLFRDGLHLTQEGHRLTAEKLSELLRENALIPSSG